MKKIFLKTCSRQLYVCLRCDTYLKENLFFEQCGMWYNVIYKKKIDFNGMMKRLLSIKKKKMKQWSREY